MNPRIPISKLMSTNLITVMKSTPLMEALTLFGEHKIHHVPVVSADRKLEGMLSQSDLVRLVGKPVEEIKLLKVADLMTSKLAKVESTDFVSTAASVFMLNKFRSLPVVEGDKIVGIITTLDLIKLIDEEEVELKDYSTK